MSSSLLSNVNSEAQHQANLLNNTPNKIKVLVEDELDVVIWHRILKRHAPQLQFDIHPYSYDTDVHGKGKAQILAQSHGFGRNFIGCIDSDYDWLLNQWTAEGSIIGGNPYIFQTYAYSVENLAVQPCGIADCMIECCHHCCDVTITLDEEYYAFITSLSDAVYDVLLWHLVLKKADRDLDQIAMGWDLIFGNGHYNHIHNDRSLSNPDKRRETLTHFSHRAEQLTNHYQLTYADLLEERLLLENELRGQFGLSHDNAYLYVRGHNLYDFLKHNFFVPIQNELRKLHRDEIRAHTSGIETGNTINHYNNLLEGKDIGREIIHRQEYIHDLSNSPNQSMESDIKTAFQ